MIIDFYRNIPGDMFDFEIFYKRIANDLPDNCVIAEVGVADGKSALFLANELYLLGKSFKLYMIDSMAYGGADQINTVYNNIIKSGLGRFIELLPYDSLNGSCKFPDVHFDFVFIDASHLYEQTKADIRLWYHKIKEDCILAGHDYATHKQVRMAVDEVVPYSITRDPIPDQQTFEPEDVLHIEDTSRKFGVWWFRKKFYLKLK